MPVARTFFKFKRRTARGGSRRRMLPNRLQTEDSVGPESLMTWKREVWVRSRRVAKACDVVGERPGHSGKQAQVKIEQNI